MRRFTDLRGCKLRGCDNHNPYSQPNKYTKHTHQKKIWNNFWKRKIILKTKCYGKLSLSYSNYFNSMLGFRCIATL